MRPWPIASRLRAACRRRRTLAAPLALLTLLHGTPADAAAFLPGETEPDPPTGEVQLPAADPAEPLAAGNGIRWELAPWRWRGKLAVDARWTRSGDARRNLQALTSGEVEFASHVWQPWFVQVRAGVGLVLARSRAQGAELPSSSDGVVDFNGRVHVSVFPSSRFPFEFRADVSDSRSAGETLVTDYRTYRVGLSQVYQPPKSNSSYALNLDHSRISGSNNLGDALTVLRASASHVWPTQSIESSLSYSLNARSDTDERSRFVNLSARHSWNPAAALNADTLATWNDSRLRSGSGLVPLETHTGILQLSTMASWRPRAGDWLHDEAAPLTVTAAARFSEASQGSGEREQRARAFNLAAGAIKELSRSWRLNGGFNFSQVQSGAARGNAEAYSVNGALSFTPDALSLGSWRYTPSASLSLGLHDASPESQRRNVGLQVSHGLGRNWQLAPTQNLSVMLAQSAGALRETPTDQNASGFSHSVGLFWQDSGSNGSQTYASASVADTRSRAQGTGTYRFFNAQLSRRSQLSRFESWSAGLTLQASRSDIEQLDPFTGELRRQDDGWQRYYSGSLSYQNQRAFGVPRLRMTWLFSANTQQLERRSSGDIDAPPERTYESLEGRLDYAVGRLDLRLTARLARLERRNAAAVALRAQRRF